jgi:hypothetical protein
MQDQKVVTNALCDDKVIKSSPTSLALCMSFITWELWPFKIWKCPLIKHMFPLQAWTKVINMESIFFFKNGCLFLNFQLQNYYSPRFTPLNVFLAQLLTFEYVEVWQALAYCIDVKQNQFSHYHLFGVIECTNLKGVLAKTKAPPFQLACAHHISIC